MILETKKYRFGFVLTTAAGNMTRYENLRKYAELDSEVECIWAPVKHYIEPNPFSYLPAPLRTRAAVMREASPVMDQAGNLDAVMFHAFEPSVLSVLRSGHGKKPLIVWSQGNPPLTEQKRQPSYGGFYNRRQWWRGLRFQFDRRCAQRTDLHLVTRQPPAQVPDHVKVHTDLCGNSPRLRELYAGCDIFVLPTRADMSPWVLLEAMATGRPVIASDVGGISDMVRPGENGFLLPLGDKAALTASLAELLTDDALRRRMGSAGRVIVEKEFSAAVCVPRTPSVMKAAINQQVQV